MYPAKKVSSRAVFFIVCAYNPYILVLHSIMVTGNGLVPRKIKELNVSPLNSTRTLSFDPENPLVMEFK